MVNLPHPRETSDQSQWNLRPFRLIQRAHGAPCPPSQSPLLRPCVCDLISISHVPLLGHVGAGARGAYLSVASFACPFLGQTAAASPSRVPASGPPDAARSRPADNRCPAGSGPAPIRLANAALAPALPPAVVKEPPMSSRPPHTASTVRLVRWYRVDSDWLSEVVTGRLVDHHGGRWRLLVGERPHDYPDAVWALCHE